MLSPTPDLQSLGPFRSLAGATRLGSAGCPVSLEDLLEVTLVSDRARIFGQLPWAAVSSRHHCHPDQGKSISDQARGREVPSIRSPMAPACTDVSDPSRGMSARGVRVPLLHTSLRRGGRQRCIVQTGFCHERGRAECHQQPRRTSPAYQGEALPRCVRRSPFDRPCGPSPRAAARDIRSWMRVCDRQMPPFDSHLFSGTWYVEGVTT